MLAEQVRTRPLALSEEDKQRFDTVGFLVFHQLFSADEMADMEAAFMRVLDKSAAEFGFDGSKRLAVVPFIEGDEYFHHLFDDDRIMGIIEGLLGEDCLYSGGSDGNFYVGNTRWHPDGGNPGYPTVKIAFYLDPVGANSGCLNVIAGSHHAGFHEAIALAMKSGVYDINSPDVPGRYPLESQPGDVVAFNHALWHSSWGGHAGRRMFTINYAKNPIYGWQTNHLRGVVENSQSSRRGIRLYSDRLVQDAGPRRMAKLRRLIEMGYCDQSKKPLTGVLQYPT